MEEEQRKMRGTYLLSRGMSGSEMSLLCKVPQGSSFPFPSHPEWLAALEELEFIKIIYEYLHLFSSPYDAHADFKPKG